jgi:transcriptional regulator with XRE-family HTH domain
MARRPNLPPRRIFLAEWINAIPGKDRKGAAHAADIDISHVNNICTGRKENPSSLVMFALAQYLGITIDDLYHPPPSGATLAELAALSAAAREALLRRRGRGNDAKRREKNEN